MKANEILELCKGAYNDWDRLYQIDSALEQADVEIIDVDTFALISWYDPYSNYSEYIVTAISDDEGPITIFSDVAIKDKSIHCGWNWKNLKELITPKNQRFGDE